MLIFLAYKFSSCTTDLSIHCVKPLGLVCECGSFCLNMYFYHKFAAQCGSGPGSKCHENADCVRNGGWEQCRCKRGFYGNGVTECKSRT